MRHRKIPIIIIGVGLLFLMLTGCTALDQSLQPDTPAKETLATPDQQQALTEETPLLTLAPTNTPALLPTTQSLATGTEALPQSIESSVGQATAVDFGTAELAIIRPGQLSRHTSPIRLNVNLRPGPDRLVEITLYGEDGRVLLQEADYAHPFDDPVNGNLIKDLEFSIEGLAETGRLEMKVYDSYGRLKALNSVYLILLSNGITERNYAPETQDRILLQLPFPDQLEIKTSPLFVSGLVRTASETPLFVSLVDAQGETAGEGRASIVLSPGTDYGQFVGEISFTVSEPTPALLTFGLEEGRIKGLTFVKTIEVMLYPPQD